MAATDLVLNLYVDGKSGLATYSSQAAELARIAPGNHAMSPVLPPAERAGPRMVTAAALATRRAVNDWIRRAGVFDGVFDVARAVENPQAPDYIRPDLDSGDGMHPNDKGAEAIAAAVDLNL
ncbi:hypothetical protein ACIA5C_03115 [Actinoplanes sp. NPDC051343]|uniref:hypothetical protein n=1 Tax=Actinoplanes sp. NPDC051343 TaxID=3363906 RepID=UPI0037A3C38B